MKDEKLIPVIVQDYTNNNVLMLAYANPKAIELTKKTGVLHFYSRSRQKIWKKGETSGNIMKVVSLSMDCDRDTILARVVPPKKSCHLNRYSCFNKNQFVQYDIFAQLHEIFKMRQKNPSKKSYTTYLLSNHERLLKKVLEEASELVLASMRRKKNEVTYEAADLMYHCMVLLFTHGLTFSVISSELSKRMKIKSISIKN